MAYGEHFLIALHHTMAAEAIKYPFLKSLVPQLKACQSQKSPLEVVVALSLTPVRSIIRFAAVLGFVATFISVRFCTRKGQDIQYQSK